MKNSQKTNICKILSGLLKAWEISNSFIPPRTFQICVFSHCFFLCRLYLPHFTTCVTLQLHFGMKLPNHQLVDPLLHKQHDELLPRPTRGGSRTTATFNMERFVIFLGLLSQSAPSWMLQQS